MESQIDKFNEKQIKSKCLAFLFDLHKSIPSDTYVAWTFEEKEKEHGISKGFLFALFRAKIISVKQTEQDILYKWDSIRPNIVMVDALLKSEREQPNQEFKPHIIEVEKRIPKIEDNEEIAIEQYDTPTENVEQVLRSYQVEGIREIFNKWKDGKKSVLFQMPTGTGKTILFTEIVKLGVNAARKRKILIVVHRKELVEQIKIELTKKGVDAGIIMADVHSDFTKHAQIAMIQTLSRREHPEADLVIIDECHHAKAETYKELWNIYPDAKFLGVTATPTRLSGEGFDDLFDELIVSMSINKFIEQKHLVPVKHYACASPDLSNVKRSRGDYETQALSRAMLTNAVMSDVVETYTEHCEGKSAIAFAVDVEHSKSIVQRFKAKGINAEHIDAKTPSDIRQRILTNFKLGIIKIVSNVEIITEGFDFPMCEAVLLARPTKSLTLYLQMVGRVMRTASNKAEGIILDNAGLWLEHGLSTMEREWQLNGTKKKREPQTNKDLIAIDEDGFIKEINRKRPMEIKGLQLIPLTAEYKRLKQFETILYNVLFEGTNKLLSAYYSYREYAEEGGNLISVDEYKYMMKRLTILNSKVPRHQSYKNGFWQIEWQRFEEEREEQRIKKNTQGERTRIFNANNYTVSS